MRLRGRLALAAALLPAALLAGSSGSSGSALPEIRGAVYQADRDHPVPGALVALYDAGDLLLDSTYTRDDGGFRLRTPLGKGRFSIVATGQGSSRKKDLDFDPAAGQDRNVTFILPAKKESFPKQAAGFLLNTLGAVFGSVVGLMVGLLFRRIVEDPAEARTKRNLFLSELEAAVEEALAQYPAAALGTRLGEITAAVNRIRQLFVRRADVEDALYKLEKDEGRARFRTLRDRLGQVEQRLAAAQGLAPNPRDESLRQVRETLIEIRDHPLG